MTFAGKVWSLLFIMLSRLLTTFLPRSKHLLISWVQSPHGDFGHQWLWRPKKIKSVTVSIVSPCICHEVMGPDAMTLVFWKLNFKQIFWLSSFTFIKRLFSSSSLSAIRVAPSAHLRLLIFLLAILITACIVYCHPAYSLDILLSRFGTSLLFHIQFWLLLPDFQYKFLRRQVRWFGITISRRIFAQFAVIFTDKDFGISNKTEIDIFLELCCVFWWSNGC